MRCSKLAHACSLSAMLLMGLSTSRSHAQNIVLDFEGLPGMDFNFGNPIPAASRLSDGYLTTYGVRFRSGAGYVAVIQLGSNHATSGVNGIGGSTPSGTLTYNAANPITAEFFDPTNPLLASVTNFVSVRGDLIGDSGESPTLFAYNINGVLIASNSQPDTGGQTMSISANGIHSVRFSGVVRPDATGGGVGLDDFTFGRVATAVPEPGSVTLLAGIVTTSAGFLARRRKQARKAV